MIAIVIGDFSLFVGFLTLFLPLLLTELSRPKDVYLGASLLGFGVVLVTAKDRFNGAPTIAILTAAFLISTLGAEIFKARWQQLSEEEKLGLGTFSRWTKSFNEFILVLARFGGLAFETAKNFNSKSKKSKVVKKWVRQEALHTETNSDSKEFDGKGLSKATIGEPLKEADPDLEGITPSKDS